MLQIRNFFHKTNHFNKLQSFLYESMPFTTEFFSPKTLSTKAINNYPLDATFRKRHEAFFIVLGEGGGQRIAKVKISMYVSQIILTPFRNM